MTKYLEYIFQFLVFPGLLFSSAVGLLTGWFDRKLTARLQYRVGPPWYQNFFDALKLLLYKETLVPRTASSFMFFAMPVVALMGSTLASTVLLVINAAPEVGFIGDLIVLVYLLTIPSIALILGGFAAGNNLASLGSSREMKLMLSYELPFLLAIIVPVMKAGYTIKIGEIISYQSAHGALISTPSGALAFIAALFCIHAKLGYGPFDMAEAETEIIGGSFIEYSGKALGIFRLSKAIMAVAAPVFLITLFFGGITSGVKGFFIGAGWFLLITVLMTLIKNTNPRVRIDQALGFFWKHVNVIALLAIAFAYFGM